MIQLQPLKKHRIYFPKLRPDSLVRFCGHGKLLLYRRSRSILLIIRFPAPVGYKIEGFKRPLNICNELCYAHTSHSGNVKLSTVHVKRDSVYRRNGEPQPRDAVFPSVSGIASYIWVPVFRRQACHEQCTEYQDLNIYHVFEMNIEQNRQQKD